MSGGADRIPIDLAAAQAASFRPKKRLGQHLLRDATVVQDMLAALAPSPQHGLLEIGPGLGALTQSLLATGLPVLAIEVDPSACVALQQRFAGQQHFHLLQADVLKVDLAAAVQSAFGSKPFHIAANLPYYITTPVLAQILESGLAFERMACLVQWEVAVRLCASPGGKEYGALTLMAQSRCDVRSLRKVPPGAFTPPPTVDSAILILERLPKPRIQSDLEHFELVVRSAFGKRRKTLRNTLLMSPWLRGTAAQIDQAITQAGLDPGIRAEALYIEAFDHLTQAVESAGIVFQTKGSVSDKAELP